VEKRGGIVGESEWHGPTMDSDGKIGVVEMDVRDGGIEVAEVDASVLAVEEFG